MFCGIKSNAFGQFITNKKGEITSHFSFFNPLTLKNKKIKSIEVSYFKKFPLKSIVLDSTKKEQYSIDTNGQITRYYSVTNSTDTSVVWQRFRKNKISNIKKNYGNSILSKAFHYENNALFALVYGKSDNLSNSKITINSSFYEEEKVEYIAYTPLNKNDTVIHTKSINNIIFKTTKISIKDSNHRLESTTFKFRPKASEKREYEYFNKNLVMLKNEGSLTKNNYFSFSYNEKNQFSKFTQFNKTSSEPIELNNIIYNDKTGELKAILTKKIKENIILIKKYKYTYYND